MPQSGPEKVRILVAEDDPAIAELLQTVLSLWGYAVETRPDGESALARALQGGFAALLIDYQMPLLTGLDLLRRLREADHPVPAILMSGYLVETLARDCASVPGVRILPKPFTLVALQEALRGAAGSA